MSTSPAWVFPYPSGEKDLLSDACKDAFGRHKDGEQVDVDEGDLDGSIDLIALCFNRRFNEVKDGFKTQIIDNAYSGASGIPHDVTSLLTGLLEDQTELKSEFSGLSQPMAAVSSGDRRDDEMSLTDMLEMEVDAMRAVPEDSQGTHVKTGFCWRHVLSVVDDIVATTIHASDVLSCTALEQLALL
eukprot:1633743-Amphidinium_carterae.1